jgi:signal transduction histidine kinase
MDHDHKTDEQLATLASHLTFRRVPILQAWRSLVDNDRELTAPSSLPRTQFNDHIPEILNAFEKRLQAWPRSEGPAAERERNEDAASHGLQRWQQGYRLREVTREWGHLHLCLADELTNYSTAHPDLEPGVMPTAWRALAEVCSQGVSDSASQYFELEKLEAAGHVRDMEQTLEEVRELEHRRTELFRQAAHDLRGNVGVVHNVTTGLAQDAVPETMRDEFMELLHRSVSSLNSMMDEVMDLARLQAGYELRNVKSFDAAVLLKELFAYLQPLATRRGLFLQADGPDTLTVEGDAVKIRRIVQNLLLNALKYTSQGGVSMSWGDSRNNDPKRWMISVKDTGPGIHAGPGAPLAEALQGATIESRHVDEKLSNDQEDSTLGEQATPVGALLKSPDPRPVHQARGEGIGLSIVKRLCELLDASLEVESAPGAGTTFRIVVPRHYNASEKKK